MTAFLLTLILVANQQPYYPEPVGYVNDFVAIISPEYKNKLNDLIVEVEKKTTAEIAIAVIKTTESEPIDMYAVNLFTKWGVGKKNKDNGVLIVVAVEDRRDWIETGYGVEGALPDAFCGEVHRQLLVSNFRKNEFGKGLWLATLAIAQRLGEEYGVEITGTEDAPKLSAVRRRGGACGSITVIVLFFLIFFLPLLFRTGFFGLFPLFLIGSRGYWTRGTFGGQGGFSGGFGGFGGGSCGGGGAGGGW